MPQNEPIGKQPDFAALQQALAQATTVALCAHVGPDGDTLGSMLGLKHTLGRHITHLKRIDPLIVGTVPHNLAFLPGASSVINLKSPPVDMPQRYDLAISVDCGSADRLGLAQAYFEGAPVRVNIDHHISNRRFGTINLLDVDAAASGQVVADILEALAIPLDADSAQCLYTALVSDTGGFKYSNTTAAVFACALKLVQAGATPEPVYKALYENQPRSQFTLHAEALAQATFNATATLGWITVSQAMLNRHGALEEHTDGLVEAIRRVDTVVGSAVFRETPEGHTKVSLRSDHDGLDVAAIVGPLGGGGHKKAAGATLTIPPDQAEAQVLPLLEAAIQSIP